MTKADRYNRGVLDADLLSGNQLTTLTEHWQGSHANLVVDGKCGPLTRKSLSASGESDTGWWDLVELSVTAWDAPDRARPRGQIAGLCVHQTSRPAVAVRLKRGMSHEEMLDDIARHYRRTGGTHYMADTEGQRLQLGSELQVAHGVGMTEQLAAESRPGYQPPARWRKRWPSLANPSEICARWHTRRLANPWLVHIELVPCPEGDHWFSHSQHQTVADLAIRLQQLGGWPGRWWEQIGRVIDHESLSPETRYRFGQGWDPGVARAVPRFDWELMIQMIENGNH